MLIAIATIIIALLALILIGVLHQNVKLRDDLSYRESNSVSLESVNPKIRASARDEVIEHIQTYWGSDGHHNA